MDANEATKVVFSRIQALDPDNASKIMGFIFIQDPPEHEMLRLATGPETTLISLMTQAKTHLGILSNTSSAPSPRIIIPNNNGFHVSPSSPSSPWPSGFSLPVPDQLDSPSFDPIVSPSGRSDSMIFPANSANIMHRRSFSVNDAYAGGEEGIGGFGWRPCMYYARGFCKNGGNCKFLHGGGHFGDLSDGEGGMVVGSPSKIDGFDDVLRMKAIQQQQRLSQLMGGGGSFPYNKGLSFVNDSPRSAAAALMMGNEFHKFGRCQSERSDFSAMGLGAADSSARQIYLTFPADSTFKEEDVSNYFSTFGPVQDVRIPYQQKRMFGFVTFVYPETVKMILAKGNPHFVCDSRVLVKPYKEKGKILEKRQHQIQFDRGDFAGCLSPTGLDPRESYDFPIGPRILNNHEMMRRKLEHAEIQQALELQGRRLMNLHLMDLKNHHHQHHHANQFHPPGAVISSPVQSHLQNNPSFLLRSESFNHEISEDIGNSLAVADGQYDELPGGKEVCDNKNTDANGNEDDFFNPGNGDLPESLEHILPDNLFSSPTKSAGENGSMFSSALSEGDSSSSVTAVPASTITSPYPLNKASPQPCYSYNMPRFVSRQEADEV